MFAGCPADVKMKEMYLEDGFYDKTSYPAIVDHYDKERERLYLQVDDELPIFSLDALYECKIADGDEGILICTGAVRERYLAKNKKNIVIQLKKGFDKQ
ncbi:hypothetical protein M2145_001983 [Lachnospiraceae bacterium PF1-21]|uniref:Uncharacterized protein n=1 Tax=Ohessyouella blattaphilus TaxID=2949333 RepID=A0ABT1EKW3_9FIRM|nr:hypothetical protein [Ohessyouella blattaphilus]MCP1109937.1 hypothetical protein [Ohessyouella blattaphilus]MCR8563331.1 hypothetical protein [Ohessyouella blattaphilus]MDL2249513.1 hypothetical protein [Lachnospiraceae bacterium OttesenSCG-928-J05]